MPCATTPAPTEDGRAKPRSTRGRTPRDADARWLEGGRHFAHGTTRWRPCSRTPLHIPPPEVKEQLRHIPPGFTAKAGPSRRMVGNGWHWGVASRLLGLLVMATWAKPVASGTSPAPPPRQGTIQWLSQFWACRGWDLAPRRVLGEGLDEESHWAAAAQMQHTLVGWPILEAILEFRRDWRHDLAGDGGRRLR